MIPPEVIRIWSDRYISRKMQDVAIFMGGILEMDYKDKRVKDIVKKIDVIYLSKGDTVYKEGDIDNAVYFI